MSSGPAPFGSLPQLANLTPDDLASLMARFGIGQPPAPPDAQAAAAGVPGSAVDMNGRIRAMMAEADPATTGAIGQPGPAVAMNEVQTRALERQTGMVPNGYGGAPQGSPDLARLLDPTAMGAPQGFGGSSGQIVPQGGPDAVPAGPSPLRRFGGLPGLGDDPGPVPLPPQRPADLSVVGVPDRGGPTATGALREGPFKDSSLGRTPADLAGITTNPPAEPRREGPRPAPLSPGGVSAPGASTGDFDPLTGAPLSGNVQAMGQPQAGAPPLGNPMQQFLGKIGLAPAATSPRAGPQPAPAPGPAGPQAPLAPVSGDMMSQFLGKSGLGGILDANPNLLTSLGISLLTNKGFGRAIGMGLQGNEEANQRQAIQAIAGQKAAIENYKFRQALAGQNQTVGVLVRAGHSPEAAAAIVASAAGGNATALNNALANAVPKTPDAPAGYRNTPDGGQDFIPRGPADPAVLERNARAVAADKTVTPLTDPAERLAAGIPAHDKRAAWKGANGNIIFDDGPQPKLATNRNPDGSSTTREYDPATRSFREVPGGGAPGVDMTGVPTGADPLTYRREVAKAAVAEGKAADQRALQAQSAMPLIDRAMNAYERLSQNGGIGPISASQPSRMVAGAFGRQNEIDRQEFEAAAKELELMKAQISMKGQGAISESERRILALTLPRLDAASPETGLTTLRSMREQFAKAIAAPGLSTSTARGQAAPPPGPDGQQQPAQVAGPPSAAVQHLQQNPGLAAQFDAKYGRGASARILGGR